MAEHFSRCTGGGGGGGGGVGGGGGGGGLGGGGGGGGGDLPSMFVSYKYIYEVRAFHTKRKDEE